MELKQELKDRMGESRLRLRWVANLTHQSHDGSPHP